MGFSKFVRPPKPRLPKEKDKKVQDRWDKKKDKKKVKV